MARSFIESVITFPVPTLVVDNENRIVAFNQQFLETFGGEPEPDSMLSDYFSEELADELICSADGPSCFSLLESNEKWYRIESLFSDSNIALVFFPTEKEQQILKIAAEAKTLSRLRFDALAVPPAQLRERTVDLAEMVRDAFPPPIIDTVAKVGNETRNITEWLLDAARLIDSAAKENQGKLEIEIPENAPAALADAEQFHECLMTLAGHVAENIIEGSRLALRVHDLDSPRGYYTWLINLVDTSQELEDPAGELFKSWRNLRPHSDPDTEFQQAGARLSIYHIEALGAVYSIRVNQPRTDSE